MIRALILLVSAACLSGCATLMFWKDNESTEESEKSPPEDQAPETSAASWSEVQELKMAKLWARLDELEEETFRQKERIRVLEKGITLGLVPEELKATKDKKPKNDPSSSSPDTFSMQAPKVDDSLSSSASRKGSSQGAPQGSSQGSSQDMPIETAKLSPQDQDSFQQMLAVAQEQYRSGRYGRAIVEYDALGKAFGNAIQGGMHRFWIAKSWANLKELNTARQLFADFLKDYPTSPWIPRAKLELGRIEWRLGFQETALKHFREIIATHPHEDAAEMARMEIESLDKSL